MYLEIILIVAFIVIIFVLYLLIYDNYLNNVYKRNILSWTTSFEEFIPIVILINDQAIYLMYETYEEILQEYMKFPSYFRKYRKQFNDWEYKDYIPLVHRMFSNEFIDNYNKDFVDNQLHKDHIIELLNNIDNKSLDDRQREVVISDERNTLVIAGAGSGKTLTISGKVLYLTKELGIDPKEILLVTFTNKASDEMKERIVLRLGVKVKVYTFHKLGLEVITKNTGYKPTIARDNLLSDVVSNYLENDIFDDPKLSEILLDFFSYYFYTPFEENEFNNLTEYYNEIKSNQLETLKNQIDGYEYLVEKLKTDKMTLNKEMVKSYEELSIANFLYLNNVKYEYERPYPNNLADISHMQYKPDFYLPDYDIYIEHYGITKDGRVPWLNKKMEQEYIRGMDWKKNIHEFDENKYFESYSFYNTEGILLRKLEDNLIKFGVVLNPKDKSDVLKQLVDNDEYFYSEFQNLISTFINQYKVNGYNSFEALEKKAEEIYRDPLRAQLFLLIVEPIYNRYQELLNETNEIDFNDMINKATILIESNSIEHNYKYIIVDEYQDISFTRYKLIDAIRNQSNSKLVVVGDDWQSIYRFAGSDVNLINDFEELNTKATLTKNLDRTYRNSQDLLDIIGSFIMKNPQQRQKHLISSKILNTPVRLIPYSESKLSAIVESVENIIDEFQNPYEILLLGRYNFDSRVKHEDKIIDITKYLRSLFKKIKFTFLTIHKSKGLEGEHVILLNAESSKLGFPSKISDDKLLELVLPKKEPLKFAEERRLFYVALTRTKNTIHIVVPKRNPSIFIMELVDDGFLPDVFSDEYIQCPKCGGSMTIRGGRFYGCLNFPLCDHTVKLEAELDKKCPWCGDYLVKRKGPYGKFYGCNSYKFNNNQIKEGCSYKLKI